MILYTCGAKKKYGGLPGVFAHPCGRAAKALDEAGHNYDVEVVGGYTLVPGSKSGNRDEIEKLTGQKSVPVVVLDNGEAIAGSYAIAKWAKDNPNS